MGTLNDLYGKVRPGSPVTSEELAAMGANQDEEFRDLVQQIMNAGWYRVGQEERTLRPVLAI